MTSPEGPPKEPLSARWLIRDLVVRFARIHGGRFDLDAGTVTELLSHDALELAGTLYELGCATRVELRPVVGPTIVSYELPPGA